MNSKKALDILFSGPVGYTLNEYNEASNVIYKSLERLEALKKENIELQLQLEQLEDSAKIRMQQVDKYATTLKEKYLDLQQENEKLKKENKENAEFYVKSRDALWDFKQQNEKLKKALEKAEEVEQENLILKVDNDQLNHIANERLKKNEKLKKKLNIYEKYTGIYYDKETKEYYIAVDCEFGCKGDVITKNEFEVLENE